MLEILEFKHDLQHLKGTAQQLRLVLTCNCMKKKYLHFFLLGLLRPLESATLHASLFGFSRWKIFFIPPFVLLFSSSSSAIRAYRPRPYPHDPAFPRSASDNKRQRPPPSRPIPEPRPGCSIAPAPETANSGQQGTASPEGTAGSPLSLKAGEERAGRQRDFLVCSSQRAQPTANTRKLSQLPI